MGIFQTRPEDEQAAWAAIPGEPVLADDPADLLPDPPAADPLSVGLGGSTSVTLSFDASATVQFSGESVADGADPAPSDAALIESPEL